MSNAVSFAAALLGGILLAGAAQAQQPGSREPFQFKKLHTGLGLSQAQLLFQAENDLLGQRTQVTNNVTTHSSTAAESLTTINANCGDDTMCQIDAVFNRDGQGSQSASQSNGNGAEPPAQ